MDTASVRRARRPTTIVVPADLAVVAEVEARHGQALFGFVRRLGLTDAEAQDCVQESLLRLALQLAAGTAIGDHKGWVFRAAYRIAMDEHRLRRRLRLWPSASTRRPCRTPPRPMSVRPCGARWTA